MTIFTIKRGHCRLSAGKKSKELDLISWSCIPTIHTGPFSLGLGVLKSLKIRPSKPMYGEKQSKIIEMEQDTSYIHQSLGKYKLSYSISRPFDHTALKERSRTSVVDYSSAFSFRLTTWCIFQEPSNLNSYFRLHVCLSFHACTLYCFIAFVGHPWPRCHSK